MARNFATLSGAEDEEEEIRWDESPVPPKGDIEGRKKYITYYFIRYGRRVVEPLLERGFEGPLILLMAALDNRIDVMDLLVEEHGVDVNTPNVYRDDWSQSILAEVAESGIITAVTWLVEHGADLEATNSLNHYTPLWAACSGYLRVVRILLEAGANPNCVKASSGNSALYMCAQHDRVAFAAELLHFGADPNLTHQPVQSGGVKMTPVMVALCNGHCEMLAMLMNAGA